mmetsp:Transcript_43015/g.102121  ORF Transcript_43015/g.102121 Transcript_43015/m.102121 type:complete len:205 (-) Transcript_43015:398-1012(-)
MAAAGRARPSCRPSARSASHCTSSSWGPPRRAMRRPPAPPPPSAADAPAGPLRPGCSTTPRPGEAEPSPGAPAGPQPGTSWAPRPRPSSAGSSPSVHGGARCCSCGPTGTSRPPTAVDGTATQWPTRLPGAACQRQAAEAFPADHWSSARSSESMRRRGLELGSLHLETLLERAAGVGALPIKHKQTLGPVKCGTLLYKPIDSC